MKTYRVAIDHRFQADDADHAIEQFIDYVLSGDSSQAIELDVEGAINVIEEVQP